MTSYVSVSTLGFAIKQFVSRFNCCPHKSFSNTRTDLGSPLMIPASAMHTHNNQQFPPVFLIKTTTELFHAKPLLRGTSRERFGIQNETWHDNNELGVVSRRLGGFAGPSTLSRRLPDFYEYMYTAQSIGGFVFISPGDMSAAALLHLFHLRRLRLALQVRSHHASMLPRHQSAAKRAQALPLLHPSLSTGNFHQFPVFSS